MQVVLWLVSFVTGAAVMVVELAGARVLAPTFGASVVPWTAVIAAVLCGVAAGNAWGGRCSRGGGTGGGSLLAGLLLLTAASVLIPLLRMDLPDLLLRRLGTVAGSLASAACLLLPASFLLGAAGPLVVAAATTELGEVGRRSGSLNGASHLGAIVGTLVTGYVLIPTLPVSRVLGLTAGILTLAAVVLHRARASTGWRAR